MIEVESARTALIELVRRSTDNALLQRALPDLENSEVIWTADTVFAFKNWHCDTTDNSFVVTFDGARAAVEYYGKFTYGDGRWTAALTGFSRSTAKN